MIEHSSIKRSDHPASLKAQSNCMPFFQPFIQPKLTINQPNDPYEQEADAVAEKVMNGVSNKQSQVFFKPTVSPVQRKCTHCEQEEKLQLKPQPAQQSSSNISSNVHGVINSSGQALDKSARDFMEPKFGHDFSNVRIHNDENAHQSSSSINARAYTHENHIVFGSGQYQPDTVAGKQLLAHELTHVVQQRDANKGILQRACADNAVKSSAWVSVKNQHDFAALDGYTPIKGKIHNVFFDGKHYFFCYNDKKIYFKYVNTQDGVIPDFEAAYGIKLETGGAKWLKSEVVLLSEALSMLSDIEASKLKGYRFIKQGGVMIEDGDRVVAGLATQDIIRNEYTIEFWKFCFDGSSDTPVKNKGSVSPGVPCILHEIGHAMMYSRSRPYMEAMYFVRKYQDAFDAATPDKKKEIKPRLDELKAIRDKAEAEFNKNPSVESEFQKLVKGKQPLTPYSKKNDREAFAEAFAIYKVDPDLLKKKNIKLFEYFERSGFDVKTSK